MICLVYSRVARGVGGLRMEPISAIIATAALTEGVAFLYAQAGEVLRSWRQRKRDRSAPPPKLIESGGVTIGPEAKPLEDPRDDLMVDTLSELREALEPIKDGTVDISSPEAREAIGALRNYLEVIVRAPVELAGEKPRELSIERIRLDAEDVERNVTGVRAKIAHTSAAIRDVDVRAKKVGGDVTGVEAT